MNRLEKPMEMTEQYNKEKDFLVCINLEGSIFNTLEIQWKECLIPTLIKCFELQPIAKYVREEAEKMSLYSKNRGLNRFMLLYLIFEALEKRPELNRYYFNLPDTANLKAWIMAENFPTLKSLEEAFDKTSDTVIERALLWSHEADRSIQELIYGMMPFPHVSKSLRKIKTFADIVVVSSNALYDLKSEWKKSGLDEEVYFFFAQNDDDKTRYIKQLKKLGYDEDNMLLIGDTLGDAKVASTSNIIFYPIIPGKESKSWKLLTDKCLDGFVNKTYITTHEQKYIQKLKKVLN